jgi:diguanylate cyclase (GGDEF)-like protein
MFAHDMLLAGSRHGTEVDRGTREPIRPQDRAPDSTQAPPGRSMAKPAAPVRVRVPEAFPQPQFLGNGNIEEFEQVAGELEQIRRLATTDAVTGLPNQAETRNMLLLYTEVAALEGAWLSACVADLDHFKEINDTHGHAAGDDALRQLGERFRDSVDSGQPIGRWGGYEFLLLLPRMDLNAARDLAEEVRCSVEGSPFQLADGTRLRLTVTIGVASGRGNGLDASLLFEAADGDLLEMKKVERNRVGAGRLISATRND